MFRSKHRAAKYTRAYDDRKRPIRGLWIRGGRYYAHLTVADLQSGRKNVRRIPLSSDTAAGAKKEMEKLGVKREDNTLPVLRRTPKVFHYADDYIAYLTQAKDAKRESTLEKEECALGRWKIHLNELRLNQITRAHVNAFIQKRQAAGAAARTVNLDVIAFRNVLKKALDEGLISALPTLGLKPLKATSPKRALFSLDQIEAGGSEAFQIGNLRFHIVRNG